MQEVIVGLILLAAAGITVYRIFFKPSCGCGCGGKKKHDRPLDQSLNEDDSLSCGCCAPNRSDGDR
ncbi:MAG: FeoB-associated Cys-rich membrane protein [Deltaproteobacteria bacterium]|nr:FeoB-associated Cys-rich membrane protein [Deltaproteobacteria bacterium]